MKIQFYKYQGAGNDFVMIDDRKGHFPTVDNDLVAKLCQRRFGIGADGLILLQSDNDYVFRMRYYNADGAEGTMCGNGGRCIAAFARDMGVVDGDNVVFIAIDGEHQVNYQGELVSLGMKDVDDIQDRGKYIFIDTGSPHYVEFVDDVQQIDVLGLGREIRYSNTFASNGGTNVNFAQLNPDNKLSIRTYERGVEGETLACGTGATAIAIAAHHKGILTQDTIQLKALGGDLTVSFECCYGMYKNIKLIGRADKVFEGEIKI